MSQSLEIEKTYLAKYIPVELSTLRSKAIKDVYIPDTEKPTIRLRQNGDKYEMTKKVQVSEGDASAHTEYTIPLSGGEFMVFTELSKKTVEKTRYYYEYLGYTIEIDVFSGLLQGLVVVDVEFPNSEAYEAFTMPDFCLVDITQEDFIAGKYLAGRSIQDISGDLDRLGYTVI